MYVALLAASQSLRLELQWDWRVFGTLLEFLV